MPSRKQQCAGGTSPPVEYGVPETDQRLFTTDQGSRALEKELEQTTIHDAHQMPNRAFTKGHPHIFSGKSTKGLKFISHGITNTINKSMRFHIDTSYTLMRDAHSIQTALVTTNPQL
jgi:hypothetical protein